MQDSDEFIESSRSHLTSRRQVVRSEMRVNGRVQTQTAD